MPKIWILEQACFPSFQSVCKKSNTLMWWAWSKAATRSFSMLIRYIWFTMIFHLPASWSSWTSFSQSIWSRRKKARPASRSWARLKSGRFSPEKMMARNCKGKSFTDTNSSKRCCIFRFRTFWSRTPMNQSSKSTSKSKSSRTFRAWWWSRDMLSQASEKVSFGQITWTKCCQWTRPH